MSGARSEVISWLRANRQSLQHGLEKARIVGFGDPTHGSHEFYRARGELLRFLVTERHFRVLAIECSAAAAESINRYIKGVDGDLPSLVTDLRSAMWDVVEFIEVLEWLRQFNSSVPQQDRVSFFGLDIWNTAAARQGVLQYIEVAAPSEAARLASWFETLGTADAQGITAASRNMPDSAVLESRQLVQRFVASRAEWAAKTGERRYWAARHQADLILQWVAANKSSLATEEVSVAIARSSGLNGVYRSQCLARNLCYSLQSLAPASKVVIWAHSYHIGVNIFEAGRGPVANMGSLLRQRWGNQYHAVLFECNKGKYLARCLESENSLGDFVHVAIPEAPIESLPWYLSRAADHPYLIHINLLTRPQSVESWLNAPRCLHAMGWAVSEPPHLYSRLVLKGYCDGLIFIPETRPTQPTQNALRAVKARATF